MSTGRFAFSLHPREYAPQPVPSLEEWNKLWEAWNMVTTKMIPREALMEKPIPLRNPLIFYLGHVPTLYTSFRTRWRLDAECFTVRTYILLEPLVIDRLNLNTILSFSNEALTLMSRTPLSVTITVSFRMNGQRWRTFCPSERRSAKESRSYTQREGR